MANQESAMFADSIVDKIERIVACLDGRSTEKINQRPPVEETNNLHVLAIHTMGNVEEGIFEILLGTPVNRDRDSEFAVVGGSAADVREKWNTFRKRLHPAIAGVTPEQLDAEYQHPRRGTISGRELLLFTATHASEHVGHAELTAQWIDAQKSS